MTNVAMMKEIIMAQDSDKKYDLRERTEKLGKDIIIFAKIIPENTITRPLINQLVRAGTSVGANYCEADDASTKKDFFYKIGICRREAQETKHWLLMIATAAPSLKDKTSLLLNEARELNLIFSAIINRRKDKKKPNDQ